MLREPVGVVAGVVPWNVPLSLSIQKIVPALLTGCSVVLKPSPETPAGRLSHSTLADGGWLPPGVVNVVPADRAASEYLISRAEVNKVTFTGSSCRSPYRRDLRYRPAAGHTGARRKVGGCGSGGR